MDSYLYTNIPIQMITCTDVDGRITPIRFRFTDRDGERITVNVERILSSDQAPKKVGVNILCASTIHGTLKHFYLYFSFFTGKWSISRIGQ